MRYTKLVQKVLSVCILVGIAPAGIAVKASAITDGHSYATHQSRHAGLAKRAEGHIQLFNRSAGSRWTFYDAQTGQPGSCETFLVNTGYTVAMNGQQMSPDLCFKTITMTSGGKTTTAKITDTCPGCPFNGLDLTQSLFGFFLGHTPTFEEGGVLQGDWEFTSDAPATKPAPAPVAASPSPPPKKEPVPITTTATHATTTKKPAAATSSAQKESSTHVPSSSASLSTKAVTSASSSTGLASALAVPTGTIDTGVNNLELLNQVIVGLGGLAMAAKNV